MAYLNTITQPAEVKDKAFASIQTVMTAIGNVEANAEEAFSNAHDYTDAETTRAKAAEEAETTRAKEAEATLQSNIDTEEKARKTADTTLQENIDVEATRAKAAESNITSNLNSEITRAKAAEEALDTAIATEKTRATSAETTLQTNIDAEASARAAADTTLQGNVDAEATRAKEAEEALGVRCDNIVVDVTTNATAIAQETSDRESAISAVYTAMETARTGMFVNVDAVDTTNKTYTKDETTTTISGADLGKIFVVAHTGENNDAGKSVGKHKDEYIVINTGDTETPVYEWDFIGDTEITLDGYATTDYVDTETSRAKGAESALSTSVKNEVTARSEADTTLQSNIDAEATARESADTTLQSNIDAEATRADTAEKANGTLISALTTRVSTLESAGAGVHIRFCGHLWTDEELDDDTGTTYTKTTKKLDGYNYCTVTHGGLEAIAHAIVHVLFMNSNSIDWSGSCNSVGTTSLHLIFFGLNDPSNLIELYMDSDAISDKDMTSSGGTEFGDVTYEGTVEFRAVINGEVFRGSHSFVPAKSVSDDGTLTYYTNEEMANLVYVYLSATLLNAATSIPSDWIFNYGQDLLANSYEAGLNAYPAPVFAAQ